MGEDEGISLRLFGVYAAATFANIAFEFDIRYGASAFLVPLPNAVASYQGI
jgi:hypothetical protein